MDVLTDDTIVVLTGRNLKALARLMAQEMRDELEKKDDTLMLTPPKLARELGISDTHIRQAMSRGKYGRNVGDGSKPCYRATVSEARAYHFTDRPRAQAQAIADDNHAFFTGRKPQK